MLTVTFQRKSEQSRVQAVLGSFSELRSASKTGEVRDPAEGNDD